MYETTYNIINTKKSPTPIGPYSQAIDTGHTIFISGQIPIHPDTKIIPIDIYEQTNQTLNNIKNIIEAANLKIKNIIKTTLFIQNINDLPEINKSYFEFFNLNKDDKDNVYLPTRSCVEVSRLPKDVKIEIEAIAVRWHTL